MPHWQAHWQSLPEYFRLHGYTTAGMGKIFHPNVRCTAQQYSFTAVRDCVCVCVVAASTLTPTTPLCIDCTCTHDLTPPQVCQGAAAGEWGPSWSLPYFHAPCISLGSIYNGTCYESDPFALPGKHVKHTHAYSNATATDSDMPDGMIADHAIAVLRNLTAERQRGAGDGSGGGGAKPFFLAMGLRECQCSVAAGAWRVLCCAGGAVGCWWFVLVARYSSMAIIA